MPRDVFRLAWQAKMSAEDSETGELMLYGEIVQDYGKFYKECFPEDKSASDFDKAVKDLKAQGVKKLNLRINSPGGIVSEAVAMRAILTGAGFQEMNIRIEGMCASAATILATIPTAHVEITPGSEYMIHNPWVMAMGNANEMQRVIDHLRQLEATSRGFYQQKSGQSDEQIKAWMDEEKWFSAEDAVKYGFADKVSEEGAEEAPAAACVTSQVMAVMKGLYKSVPDAVTERPDEPTKPQNQTVTQDDLILQHIPKTNTGEMTEPAETAGTNGSNAAPVAGAAPVIHHEEETSMDIKELNVDQLRAENPALLQEIQQAAVTAERQRQDEIDALTDPGYEELAAQAKANGTSPAEFVKQLVAAKKQKGTAYQAARQQETAPAAKVTGDTGADTRPSEDDEIKAYAQSVAAYAKTYRGNADGGMY